MPHDGLLVALWLNDIATENPGITISEGIGIEPTSPDGFHVTVGWFGNVSDISENVLNTFLRYMEIVAGFFQPFEIVLSGIGRFSASNSSDGKDVIYASVDSPVLESLRSSAVQWANFAGVSSPSEHGYTPHITIAYIDKELSIGIAAFPTISKTVSALTVKVGDTVYSFSFGVNHDFAAPTKIAKSDSARQLVFGWGNVSLQTDGGQLLDLQKDLIDPQDLEEAAYQFVLNFRETGEMHEGTAVGKLVESLFLDAEKAVAMGFPGIPEGAPQVGWWVGFKIDDPEVFAKVIDGTYNMFSIQGKAIREAV